MAPESQNCLVLDVGKTNVKIHVLNARQESLAVHHRDNVVLATVPYPHADVTGIWNWMMEVFRAVAGEFAIGAIAVSTHGATAALVDSKRGGDGLVLPVLDYEWAGVEEDATDYDALRPPFAETSSPRLPLGLNLGRQLYWLQNNFAERFAEAEAILMYPQYWAWRMSGKMATEVSSLGCHTDLWAPAAGSYSSLVQKLGWSGLMPTLAPAWESLGPICTEVAQGTGLSPGCRVHVGVHDSNASLLRFLLAMPERDFCVVSSGTWVICMSGEGSVDMLDESRDMLANVDVRGDTVPCIRFMGGREYAEVCARTGANADRAVSRDDVARVMAGEAFALPDFSAGSGPFAGRAPQIVGRVEACLGSALATLYCALMVDCCLDLLRARKDVIIVGSFLQNPMLCALVAQLRGTQAVHLSSDTAGTVRGAAQLTDWDRPVSVNLKRCAPAGLEGLEDYASCWRQLAGAES